MGCTPTSIPPSTGNCDVPRCVPLYVQRTTTHSPSATELRVVSLASGKLVLISPSTFRTSARPTCRPWFRQSSAKQLAAASRLPRLNASLNCSAMRRLVSVMSKEAAPIAARFASRPHRSSGLNQTHGGAWAAGAGRWFGAAQWFLTTLPCYLASGQNHEAAGRRTGRKNGRDKIGAGFSEKRYAELYLLRSQRRYRGAPTAPCARKVQGVRAVIWQVV